MNRLLVYGLHENSANSLPIISLPKQKSYEDNDFCREMNFFDTLFFSAKQKNFKSRVDFKIIEPKKPNTAQTTNNLCLQWQYPPLPVPNQE